MKTEGLIPEEYLVLRRHYYVLAMNFSIQMVICIEENILKIKEK